MQANDPGGDISAKDSFNVGPEPRKVDTGI